MFIGRHYGHRRNRVKQYFKRLGGVTLIAIADAMSTIVVIKYPRLKLYSAIGNTCFETGISCRADYGC